MKKINHEAGKESSWIASVGRLVREHRSKGGPEW